MMGFKFASRYGKAEEGNPNGVGAKLEKVRGQLQALAGKGQTEVGGKQGAETVTDDAGFPADRAEAFLREEALVRESLALFGVDYDGLIAMNTRDGKPSVYAQAVQANPSVVEEVARAERPVVAALKVALGFRPVAEFTDRYGDTPDKIKAAMRAEVEQELKGGEGAQAAPKAPVGPVFSTQAGGRAAGGQTKKPNGLKDVFGR